MNNSTNDHPRLLAFYLPQYHRTKENDEWWGAGFTDWVNVAQARPRFRGHYQPHVPADLGFYDLRCERTRLDQAELAVEYGIYGFCYYHYWFNGAVLLGEPLEQVRRTGRPDLPFCVCWANENWTRAWDGLERQVLIRQNYSDVDAEAHIAWLLPLFEDSRYIKIEGKPLFIIYRPDELPDGSRVLSLWRRRAIEAGFGGIYFVAVSSASTSLMETALIQQGYDAVLGFQPNRLDFPPPVGLQQALIRAAQRFLPDALYQVMKTTGSAHKVVDYAELVKRVIGRPWPREYRKFPCVFPSWDNTARRKTPTIIQNTRPEEYAKWLQHAMATVDEYREGPKFVFINAWNEWAEGCHLEPDRRVGKGFLEATLAEVRRNRAKEDAK